MLSVVESAARLRRRHEGFRRHVRVAALSGRRRDLPRTTDGDAPSEVTMRSDGKLLLMVGVVAATVSAGRAQDAPALSR